MWLATQNHSTLVTERSAVPFLPVNPEYSATRNQVGGSVGGLGSSSPPGAASSGGLPSSAAIVRAGPGWACSSPPLPQAPLARLALRLGVGKKLLCEHLASSLGRWVPASS